ncbi:MAG: exostosin family protein [Planctomycetota bacterium]
MNVYLASVLGAPDDSPVVRAFRDLAARSGERRHLLVDDPEAAGLILIVDLHLLADWRAAALGRHPLRRRFPEKVLIYNERDEPWCVWPGLYASMPARCLDPRRQRAWPYYRVGADVVREPSFDGADLLFSFMGSPSHRCRRPLLSLSHPRALVRDTRGFVFFDRGSDPVGHARQRSAYLDVLRRSKFVLCPRGRGTSSIRLYETMAAGRAPVIIADDWVAPDGPDWDTFALRVPEAEAASLPRRLEAMEDEAADRGAAAAAAWDRCFAAPVMFDRMIDAGVGLIEAGAPLLGPRRGRRFARLGAQHTLYRGRVAAARTARRLGLLPGGPTPTPTPAPTPAPTEPAAV